MTDEAGDARMTLGVKWNSYLGVVIPADAGAVQVKECRRAFYAGARALLSLMNGAISDDPEPTQADLEFMRKIEGELTQFAADVVAGRD